MSYASETTKGNHMATVEEMAQAIREEAGKEKHANSYGWTAFLECYTPEELRRFVTDCECKTVGEAVHWAHRIAEARNEQDAAARW